MSKLKKQLPGTVPQSEMISKLSRTPEEQIADLTARLSAAEDTIAALQATVDRLLNHTHELKLGFQKPWWPISPPVPGNDALLLAFASGHSFEHQKQTSPPKL